MLISFTKPELSMIEVAVKDRYDYELRKRNLPGARQYIGVWHKVRFHLHQEEIR